MVPLICYPIEQTALFKFIFKNNPVIAVFISI